MFGQDQSTQIKPERSSLGPEDKLASAAPKTHVNPNGQPESRVWTEGRGHLTLAQSRPLRVKMQHHPQTLRLSDRTAQ